MEISIPQNERVLIAGMTGSGKTYFAERLLEPAKRLIVFDNKNNLKKRLNLVSPTKKNLMKFLRGADMRLHIPSPVLSDDGGEEYYNYWWRLVYEAANCTVYIDELLTMIKNAQTYSPFMKATYVTSREPVIKNGRVVKGNVGVIASTQRPANIPTFTMTESGEFFVFTLQNPDDRDKLAQYTRPELEEIVPDEHGFYHYSKTTRAVTYHEKLA